MPAKVSQDTITGVISAEKSECLILTGMPGAGKSTVSRLVAESLPRAACLDGDFINRLVLGGRVGFGQEPVEEWNRQIDLMNRNMAMLSANFADAGFTPVIDSLLPDRRQVDDIVDRLAPRPVLLVVLSPGIDACVYRNTIRHPDHQFFFDGYEGLEAAMRREFGDVGWWFDTSALTPEQTAARVVAEAGRRALVKR
ncbi:adenylyl-sulfate kinase [Catenulispora yoronensis]|uniref:adenylyl-sulfate kinase n=1 Tax=Catenulispora yoronensis TaxID=450799 RepID=UPI0031D19314